MGKEDTDDFITLAGGHKIKKDENDWVYKDVQSRIKEESKKSVEVRDKEYQNYVLQYFDQTINNDKKKIKKEKEMKKILTADEYTVRIDVMMTQVYKRLRETPPEYILDYDNLDDDIYWSIPPLPMDPRFQFNEDEINEALG